MLSKSTKLGGDSIQLLPLSDDGVVVSLEGQSIPQLQTQPKIEPAMPRKFAREDKDPEQERLQRSGILELDPVTFGQHGIYWDDRRPTSEHSIADDSLFLLPIQLRTQTGSIWEEEMAILTSETPSRIIADPRNPDSDGYLHYFLTNEKLFPSSECSFKTSALFGGKQIDSHDIDALLLQPVEGQKGQYRRVGLVVIKSMVHSPKAHRSRLKRQSARIIADAMRRSRLDSDRYLELNEDSATYLIEIV